MSHYANESGTIQAYVTHYPGMNRSRNYMLEIFEHGRLTERSWRKTRESAEKELRRRGIQ